MRHTNNEIKRTWDMARSFDGDFVWVMSGIKDPEKWGKWEKCGFHDFSSRDLKI